MTDIFFTLEPNPSQRGCTTDYPYCTGDVFDTRADTPLGGRFSLDPNARAFIALSAIGRYWTADAATIATETGLGESRTLELVGALSD